MTRVYISIGSNISRDENVRQSVYFLEKYFSNLLLSSVYETEAVGFEGDDFFNLVVAADTDQDLKTVRGWLQKIEEQQGRLRTQARFTPRTIDLDLLLFGNEIIKQQGFEIPRAEITEYAFVLKPLAEIAPAEQHPVTGYTYSQLWDEFDREGQALTKIDFQWGDHSDFSS